jgi:hypothetical protein
MLGVCTSLFNEALRPEGEPCQITLEVLRQCPARDIAVR